MQERGTSPVPAAPKSGFFNTTTWKASEPFVLGGLSGIIATTIVQPIDMVKVRIQLAGEGSKGKGANPLTVTKNIIAQDGVRTHDIVHGPDLRASAEA